MPDAARRKSNSMKKIKSGELFQHLGGFLSSKGIELKAGAYAKRIEQGCEVLTSFINVSQTGLQKARTETGKKLDQVRQVIHEKTAPKPAPAPPTPPPPRQPTPTLKRKSAKAKGKAKRPAPPKPAKRSR
jgi:hypothetical protein